jgi:putative tricarboxylic transport membrane protein
MTNRKEVAASLVVILFGAVFLFYTTRYPLDTWESPGPAVFPLILGVLLMALSAGQLVQVLWKAWRQEHHDRPGHESGLKSLLRNSGEWKAFRMIALFILYLLMMQWIGFFVSTFLFAILSSRLTEAEDWGRPIALSTGITLFCYLLFEVWLKLSFPRGILF